MNDSIKDFTEKLNTLVKNAQVVINDREGEPTLNSILAGINFDSAKIANKCEASGHADCETFLPLFIMEIEFLNSKYGQIKSDVWLEAVDVVLESIEKFLNYPLVGIVREVVRIACIFLKARNGGN